MTTTLGEDGPPKCIRHPSRDALYALTERMKAPTPLCEECALGLSVSGGEQP